MRPKIVDEVLKAHGTTLSGTSNPVTTNHDHRADQDGIKGSDTPSINPIITDNKPSKKRTNCSDQQSPRKK